MWLIKRIDEADFGCEERMPGEPLMVLVTVESDNGETTQFEVADKWLDTMGLDEGDEWPDDLIKQADSDEDRILRQSDWMNNFLDAMDEMEE